ncbi:MAG: CobW family GTP-binding protein [Gammaproteobacteria bacterium]
MNKPTPVTVVTGFLGSGKTTLLTSLVKNRHTRRLAILINEFGAVSIDGAIVRTSADGREEVEIYDFPHGLIAYDEDEMFMPTMRAFAERRATIDHVLIETSGLALPSAVMEMLQTSDLASDFVLDATLAVVDTPLLLSGRFDRGDALSGSQAAIASLFEQQIENADVVVLNKIDDLDEGTLLSAEATLRQRTPTVRFLELAYQARLDIRLALGLRLHQPTFQAQGHGYPPMTSAPEPSIQPLTYQGRLDRHRHSGLGAHTHGLMTHKHFHEHDPGWLSFVLHSHEPQDMTKLEAALVAAARDEPIVRTKGFVRAGDTAHAMLVEGVRTRVRLTVDTARACPSESQLVFIGYHADRTQVAALLSELTATSWH